VCARGLAAAAVVASGAVLLAGCGGSSGSAAPPTTSASGTRANAIPGTEDYEPGPVRVSFLLLNGQGAEVDRRSVKVAVATSDKGKPFTTAPAQLEPIGVRGSTPAAGDVSRIYVAHFSVPRAGIYTLTATSAGEKPVRATWHIQVRKTPAAPGIGTKAIAIATPTIASTHGNLGALTTRTPPDTPLLRYSVADSLAAHKPFVLVFATPKFCTSRTCGPVVDVVLAVQRQLAKTGVRFIHVEIYEDNNPGKGDNQWVRQWHLPTEPWIFLVGRDGRIKGRFEGSVSAAELAAAVRRDLT
jgi:hypothetical protein